MSELLLNKLPDVAQILHSTSENWKGKVFIKTCSRYFCASFCHTSFCRVISSHSWSLWRKETFLIPPSRGQQLRLQLSKALAWLAVCVFVLRGTWVPAGKCPSPGVALALLSAAQVLATWRGKSHVSVWIVVRGNCEQKETFPGLGREELQGDLPCSSPSVPAQPASPQLQGDTDVLSKYE